jgi:hypothetical protein
VAVICICRLQSIPRKIGVPFVILECLPGNPPISWCPAAQTGAKRDIAKKLHGQITDMVIQLGAFFAANAEQADQAFAAVGGSSTR